MVCGDFCSFTYTEELCMSVFISREYEPTLSFESSVIDRIETIIRDVIDGAIDYVSCPYECTVEVILTDNASIRAINLANRKIDEPTDVLSFPMLDYETPGEFAFLEEDAAVDFFDPDSGKLVLGDIVISLERAMAQAEEYGHSLLREVAFLTAHSMLHLFGYDHMEEEERLEMERMQDEILSMKGYTRDYE